MEKRQEYDVDYCFKLDTESQQIVDSHMEVIAKFYESHPAPKHPEVMKLVVKNDGVKKELAKIIRKKYNGGLYTNWSAKESDFVVKKFPPSKTAESPEDVSTQ